MTISAPLTAAETLERIITPTDTLEIDVAGRLRVDGHDAVELCERFGSPLFVVSRTTLRQNHRRISAAFSEAWPGPVRVLYAVKANNNLAICETLAQDGAGFDCFGKAELFAALAAGGAPERIVVNGSNKSPEEITVAVRRGVRINIDSEEEIEFAASAARATGVGARVSLRLKVVPDALRATGSDYFGVTPGELGRFFEHEKWGFSLDPAMSLVSAILRHPELELEGYNAHAGRFGSDPAGYASWAAEMSQMVVALKSETGYHPKVINLGGGWPRERDPESRSSRSATQTIEVYGAAVCDALRSALESTGQALPELWLESGRYIVGNAVVLLTTVGAIKRDCDRVWINVDASTNNLMRRDTSDTAYHVIPAQHLREPLSELVDIVGPTCIPSILGAGVPVPTLARDDVLTVLDAGMYAETTSTQFNGLPRPATVMVDGTSAETIKERETIADIFAKHRIPGRARPLEDFEDA